MHNVVPQNLLARPNPTSESLTQRQEELNKAKILSIHCRHPKLILNGSAPYRADTCFGEADDGRSMTNMARFSELGALPLLG